MNNGGSGGGGGPGVKNPLFSLRRPLARATDSLAAEKGGAGGGELYILGARNPPAAELARHYMYIYIYYTSTPTRRSNPFCARETF
jgi:hypothetical protein